MTGDDPLLEPVLLPEAGAAPVTGAVTTRHSATLAWAGFLALAMVLAGCTSAMSAPPPEVQRQAVPNAAPAITLGTATAPLIPTPATTPSVSQGPVSDGPGVPAASLAAQGEKRLAIIQKGDWTFIKSGGIVNLGNGFMAQLFLAPYPPTRLTSVLDVYVTQHGEPIAGANADMTYDMLGMAHGPWVSVADNQRNGHYLLATNYIMFGTWEHKLVLDLPEDRYELGVGMVVFPGAR